MQGNPEETRRKKDKQLQQALKKRNGKSEWCPGDKHNGTMKTVLNPIEKKEEENTLRYNKQVVDQISNSLQILDSESQEFLTHITSNNQVGEELEPDNIQQDLEEENTDYTLEEVRDNLDRMEDYGMVSDGRLTRRAHLTEDIGSQVEEYIQDLKSNSELLLEDARESEMFESLKADLSPEYGGRASEEFLNSSVNNQIDNFIDTFRPKSSKPTNRLMAFLTSAEADSFDKLGRLTGYNTDESARETVRHIGEEGYLKMEDGDVILNPAGEAVKNAIDNVYDQFEELYISERAEKISKMAQNHVEASQKAKAYDETVENVENTGIMDLEEVENQFESNADSVAKYVSDRYDTDLE